jgi:uncharacterized protein
VQAGEWIKRAALQGHGDAVLDYGLMVFRGEGVQKDEGIGAQWLMVAARQGNPVAQNRLARLYAVGRGVDAEPVEAAKWHLLATEGGRRDAELDTFLQGLSDEQRQEARERADRFNAEAANKLAGAGKTDRAQ